MANEYQHLPSLLLLFAGVHFDVANTIRPWAAYATIHGKQHALGNFKTQKAAARYYDKMVKKHYGDDAITNFDEGGNR